MSMVLVSSVGAGLVAVAVAGWWVHRRWERHLDRSRRVRKSAERERADDLRDCLLAHQSLVPDRTATGFESPAGEGEPPSAASSPQRRGAEERWQRAYSKFDPDLPPARGSGS
ncbi:MAG: hypothetical protein F9K18_02245 [Thermoanaerobaculia bacterium]|nr:MAG: hypothetical protein F9K18_02245 [Thermoanaerobaculia bacterium]